MTEKLRPASFQNMSTRIYVSILGTLTGISGIIHGLFEALQGNKPTGGFVLPSIGAVSVIPNFLITGLFSMGVGFIIIIWILGFIQRPTGPILFLIFCVILFFVGGGVAQIIGFLLAFIIATQIRNSLSWWEKRIAKPTHQVFARLWLPFLALGFVVFMTGFFIWLFIVPPGETRGITMTHFILWSFLLIGLILLIIDIFFGFSRDIIMRNRPPII